jgi:transposase
LTARKLLQIKDHNVEISLGGVLRGFGLKVGQTTPRTFVDRICELVAGHGTLSTWLRRCSRRNALRAMIDK